MLRVCIISLLSFFLLSCVSNPGEEDAAAGSLFIIGGGKRSKAMMEEMLHLAEVRDGYIIVLPMASEEPDTAFYYARRSFQEAGASTVLNYDNGQRALSTEQLDSIRNAPLIYISGGDQNKFMAQVRVSPVYSALKDAYQKGAMIAGTSAGAAVMSRMMITGNQLTLEDYSSNFRTLNANNIEIGEGMGFLEEVIIDQHFIWRMRMNRLMSAVMEHPECCGIGIDESTAIYVQGKKVSVIGDYQVVVLKNTKKATRIKNALLGAEQMELSVYLPGDEFSLD